MATTTTVQQVMDTEFQGTESTEPIRHARRRMSSRSLRSLIVVENGRPVGIIEWRAVREPDEGDLDRPVTDFMTTDFAVLRPDMTIEDAASRIGHDVDIDHVPVVDDDGRLIGQVPRESIVQTGRRSDDGDAYVRDTLSPNTERIPIEEGMDVVGSAGAKLGTVDEFMYETSGKLGALLVNHGLLGRSQKRLPGDVVKGVEDGKVILGIDKMEFGMLSDVGDEQQ